MPRIFWLICLLLVSLSTAAPNFIRSDGGLDMPQAKQAYKDGDFDKVRIGLESFLRQNKNAAREERIFAYKYLGVVYATQENGKAHSETYFHQLLDLSPNVEVAEMYVSKSVEDFFHQIKKNHQQRISYNEKYDEFGNLNAAPGGKGASNKDGTAASKSSTATTSSRSPQPVNRQQRVAAKRPVWPWILAGGAVAVGVTVYIISQKGSETKTTVVDVSK